MVATYPVRLVALVEATKGAYPRLRASNGGRKRVGKVSNVRAAGSPSGHVAIIERDYQPDVLQVVDTYPGGRHLSRPYNTYPDPTSSSCEVYVDQQPRVLVLYTGGTIGMIRGDRGYAPAPGMLKRYLSQMPLFHDPDYPEFTTPRDPAGGRIYFEVREYSQLLDSANMGLEDWGRIAQDIESNYCAFDGFVVLHGTDTITYTASALSFMLEDLAKPVILTGSQIPITEPRTDAIDNLLGALTVAGQVPVPEVCLYFHHKLLRGNRTRKSDASGFDAFRSDNLAPLAEIGIDVRTSWSLLRRPQDGDLKVRRITEPNVACLRVFPGITEEILRNFLKPPLRGLVLTTYGSGNFPDNRPELFRALRQATDDGVVVVNCTQCARGSVGLHYVYPFNEPRPPDPGGACYASG